MATSRTVEPGGPAEPPEPPESPEQLTLEWLPYVEKVATRLCRRNGLTREETEDVVGDLRCKLLMDDYEVARRYQGRSKPSTYFHLVVSNFFHDWQNRHWGKWRPSAEAERMGPVAIQLDRLLTREGHSFDVACRMLRDNYKVQLSEAELAAMAERIPPRWRRGFEDEEVLESMPSPAEGPEAELARRQRGDLKCRLLDALARARKALPPDDRLIVKLHFEKGMSRADIARGLKLEEKPFYVRFKRILRDLRAALESEGFKGDDLGGLFEDTDDEG